MTRRGFSLLEIIIATAVLASSAMVLISLIGLGVKYGNRAEERAIALSQAESLMDEFLAQLGTVENQDEQSGTLIGPPPRNYRITAAPFEFGDAWRAGSGGESGEVSGRGQGGGLLRVTVEMFEAGSGSAAVGSSQSGSSQSGSRTADLKPLIGLSRLVRRPPDASEGSGAVELGQNRLLQGEISGLDASQQGAFP